MVKSKKKKKKNVNNFSCPDDLGILDKEKSLFGPKVLSIKENELFHVTC